MKLLAVDGNSLINRAFYGIKLLTTKDGQYTNGVYGFINMLNHIIEAEHPDCIAVAFDLRAKTFRHKMYSEYKAGRKGMPDELASQLPILKEWLTLMGYSVLSMEGFEADDILGTLSAAANGTDNECIIATGDRDSFQLVSEKVTVLNTVTKMGRPEIVRYDSAAILEKYGVTPKGMIEIKALWGDSSDNIPGARGIGEKTACSLIQEFGNIENIYENLDTLPIKEGVKAKLQESRENVFLSKELGTICLDVPISTNYNDYIIGEQKTEELSRLMTRLEFYKLMEKMGLTATADLNENTVTGVYNVDTAEITSGDTVDIYFSNGRIGVCKGESVFEICDIAKIKELLENENIVKNIYNIKNFWHYCFKNNIDLKGENFDAMLAGYVLNPSQKSFEIERLSAEYGATVEVPSGDELLINTALLCESTKILLKRIDETESHDLLFNIEIPLSRVLASMEYYGFLVDAEGIVKMGEDIAATLEQLEAQIYMLSGEKFNINSPKQLGTILFEKLGLPTKKKTKSGYSTGAEVLESLIDAHPIISLILEYRKLAKLKSTYCDGLAAAVTDSGRIHSTLNQTETRTGRISSLEPNLQNIPVKTREGRELRKYFKAEEGYVLLDADYSQIELRVLAHMAKDERMIDAFVRGVDIHTVTASQVFKIPESMVTDTMRRNAKAVNFGIVYGIGAFSLSKDIGVSRREADEYIKGYLNTYSGVDRFMKDTVENARQKGFVSTMYNRRRYLPELASSNGMIKAAGERIARNMPIQGSAADIIKIAMVRVYNRLLREKLDARLIMQVHDELIVEAKEDIAPYCAELLSEEMQNAAELRVPLIAETNIGKTWYEAKD